MPSQAAKGYLPRRCGPQAPIGTVSGLQAAEAPCEVATIDGAVLAKKTIEAPSLKILRDTATGVVAMVGLRGRLAPGVFVLNQAPAILVYLSGAQVAEADDRTKRGGGGVVARRGDDFCWWCCRRLVRLGRLGEQGITVGGTRWRDLIVRHGRGGVLPPLGLGPSRRHEGQSFRRQGGGARHSQAGGRGHGQPGGRRNRGGCRRGAGVRESARRRGAGSHVSSDALFFALRIGISAMI
jgi:hypothetical protein